MGTLFDPGIFSIVGLSGEILPGSSLAWYKAGTSTPLDTYADEALTTPNPNPVPVGNDGRIPPVWLKDASYKLVLLDPNDVTLVTREPIIPLSLSLAAPDGSSHVGFAQSGAGTINSNVQDQLRFFIRPEQFGALRDAVNDDQPAIMLADAFAAATGATVLFSSGVYRVRAKLAKSYKTSWYAQGNPFPVIVGSVPQANQAESGTQFMWDHGDNCVEMIGPSAYHQCGMIENIGIVGTGRTTGNAWVFDKIGSLRLRNLRSWASHGDAFVLGVSVGDVTGQFHIEDLYANSPRGICYNNRSKWLKATKIESDGGTIGYFGNDAPNTDIAQFHFEGCSDRAMVLAGVSGDSRFHGGFLGMTVSSATKAIEVQSAGGNTNCCFEDINIIGNASLTHGIDIVSNAVRTTVQNCRFVSCPIGLNDTSAETMVLSNRFDSCGLPIQAQGDKAIIHSNEFISTTGSYCIDHLNGEHGIWEGNVFDKPLKPTKYGGTQGNFGTNRVTDNMGYKTRASGVQNFTSSTGGNIPHTLSVVPYRYQVYRLDGGPMPSGFTIGTVDATNIAISWTGSGTYSFGWEAEAICEGV